MSKDWGPRQGSGDSSGWDLRDRSGNRGRGSLGRIFAAGGRARLLAPVAIDLFLEAANFAKEPIDLELLLSLQLLVYFPKRWCSVVTGLSSGDQSRGSGDGQSVGAHGSETPWPVGLRVGKHLSWCWH